MARRQRGEAWRKGDGVNRMTGPPAHLPRATGDGKGKRPCLKCGGTFVSHGFGNRVCGACKMINENLNGDVASVAVEVLEL